MTLTVRDREPVPPSVWLGTQYFYSESEGPRYETTARDEEVIDSRMLMDPELGSHQAITGYWSAPSTTPISISLSGAVVNQRISVWVRATTVASIEYQVSPFSSWPMLEAFRRGLRSLQAERHWSRFLARLPLLSVVETPTSDPARTTPATQAVPTVLPATDEVKTAIAETQSILDLTTPEMSAATGVGLRTLRRWNAKPVRPRRHTARAILRLYAAARALRRVLGPDGVSTWLHSGSPSPMDVLVGGDLPAFEGLVRTHVLAGERDRRPYSGFAEDPEVEAEPNTRRFRRAARRPSQGRLGSR